MFNPKDKNKLLQKHAELENVGKSLYRYNALVQSGISTEKEEKSISNLVLKGGISNVKYVWHSENSDTTCEECSSLDGIVYDFEDEVPERPHPNCRCSVEIVDYNDDNEESDDKQCNCLEQLEEWLNECEKACSEAENINTHMENSKNEMEDIINYVLSYPFNDFEIFLSEAERIISGTLELLNDLLFQIIESINIFWNNYNDLIQLKEEVGHYVNWSAEYYHINANCQAAQLGDTGAKTAEILGYLRELGDFPKEILFKGQSIKQAFNHSMHDLEVNEEGRKIGNKNSNSDCETIIKGRIKVDWPRK